MLTNYVVFKVTDRTPDFLIDKLLEISKKYEGVNASWDETLRLLSFKDFNKLNNSAGMIKYLASLREWKDVSEQIKEVRNYKIQNLIQNLKVK